jgi:hypothetical protein
MDRVLETRSANSEMKHPGHVFRVVQQPVDHAGGKSVTSTYAIHNMGDLKDGGQIVAMPVKKQPPPGVVAGADGPTKGDGDLLEIWKAVHQSLGHRSILVPIDLASHNIGVGCLDAENLLCILFIADSHIAVLH